MLYTKLYPWQIYTYFKEPFLQKKGNLTLDVSLMKRDLASLWNNYFFKEQRGIYHDGGWKAISLINHNGNVFDDDTTLSNTPVFTSAIKECRYIKEVLEELKSKIFVARLMVLEPNKNVNWHVDPIFGIQKNTVRLHFPIVTNNKVEFQISHENCKWKPGEFWLGEFTFCHRLRNLGKTNRIHLVIDVEINNKITDLFETDIHKLILNNKKYRSVSQNLFQFYQFSIGKLVNRKYKRNNEKYFEKLNSLENSLIEILKTDSKNSKSNYLMAKLQVEKGNKKLALDHLESAIQGDFNFKEAIELRENVKSSNPLNIN